MGSLPIPGEMYINDFPDKSLYTVIRENHTVGNYDGLPNEDGRHIAFLYGADIQNGDMLSAEYKRPVTLSLLILILIAENHQLLRLIIDFFSKVKIKVMC